MKINSATVKSAEQYVTDLLSKELDRNFLFHNLSHTMEVVKAAGCLCEANSLNKFEKRAVLVAAWFHDTGYTKQTDGHESIGAGFAEKFLREHDIDEEDIETVKCCIMATRYPSHPFTLPEMILCDADMSHLAAKNYLPRVEELRKEWLYTKQQDYTDAEWYASNIAFMSQQSYHTMYAQENFEKLKKRNIKKLKESLTLMSNGKDVDDPVGTELVLHSKGKLKEPKSEKGIETMFKLTSGNHVKLSAMADNKAHILLSINSIIISVTLSLLAKYLDEMPYLIPPAILLLFVCLATIVFAVLTTKPKVSKGVFTKQQIEDRQANLLFFGNFHSMEWEAYEWGIREIMYDKDYLYKSLTKDIYFLGKVLAAKYRYLDIAYKVFMYGLIASVIAFATSFLLIHP